MTEQIGKITLDYTYYPGEDLYCDGEIEQEILSIAKTYSPLEFPTIIEERKSWPILYHLSELRGNIVDWLPMDKSMKVLEVGSGCGAITGTLSKKAGHVTCIDLSSNRSRINAYRNSECDNIEIHVGNFKDIEPHLPCDYDYVCLIGVFEYGQSYIGGETPFEEFYRIIKKHVKQGGRLVIAIENKYGLKYFAGCREDHLGTFFSGIEDYHDGGGVRTFSRKGLEDIIKGNGDEEYHFYYPYPDYKFMTTLYSDRRLPRVGELRDNKRNFDRDRMVLFDEKNAFDGLIREEMFPFFSNSYMVVIGEEPRGEYYRYSNDRGIITAIRTEILSRLGRRRVRKTATSPYGTDHIRAIYSSYLKLKERYEGSGLSVNKCSFVDGEQPYIELEYVEGKTLEEILDECVRRKDEEGFTRLFTEYYEKISYGQQESIADYDMIFGNIIISENTWTLIDYEWTYDYPVEAKEIAFRALFCYLSENEDRNFFDLSQLFELMEIRPEEQEEFREKEVKFQRKVLGKRRSMSEIRDLIGEKMFFPERWLESIDKEEGKERIQVYVDKGRGYSEEESYFLPDAYVGENDIEIDLSLESGISNLRIDPGMESCMVRIEEFTYNGEKIPYQNKRAVTINGKMAGDTFVFSTNDPNIHIHLENFNQKQTNSLWLKMKIQKCDRDMVADLEQELKRKIRW